MGTKVKALFVVTAMLLSINIFAQVSSAYQVAGDYPVKFAGQDAFYVSGEQVMATYIEDRGNWDKYIVFARSEDMGETFTYTDVYGPVVYDEFSGPVIDVNDAGDVAIYFSHGIVAGQCYRAEMPFGGSAFEVFTVEGYANIPRAFVRDNEADLMVEPFGYWDNLSRFSGFFNYTQSENGGICYYAGSELWGPIHTNDDIWLKNYTGWPMFHRFVSASGQFRYANGTPNPEWVFLGGYAEETRVLDIFEPSMENIITPFGDSPSELHEIIYVKLMGNSYDVMYGDIVPDSVATQFTVYDIYPPFGPIGDSIGVNSIVLSDTVWTAGTSGTVPSGSIVAVYDELWIKGEITGMQTWLCTEDIYIVDDLTYVNTAVGDNPDGSDGSPMNHIDLLGLYSDKKIYIQYGLWDPRDSLRHHYNCPDVYIYGSLCAIKGIENDNYHDDGLFTFQYQHPHQSTPNVVMDSTYYTHIDLHLCNYPPANPPYWPWPARGGGGYSYNPLGDSAGPDYPWHNPLWPEWTPYKERGTKYHFGGEATYRRGFTHRAGSSPLDTGYWDLENYMYGPTPEYGFNVPGASGGGIGYDAERIWDSRLDYISPPGFPIACFELTEDEPALSVYTRSAGSSEWTLHSEIESDYPITDYVIASTEEAFYVIYADMGNGEDVLPHYRILSVLETSQTNTLLDMPYEPDSRLKKLIVADVLYLQMAGDDFAPESDRILCIDAGDVSVVHESGVLSASLGQDTEGNISLTEHHEDGQMDVSRLDNGEFTQVYQWNTGIVIPPNVFARSSVSVSFNDSDSVLVAIFIPETAFSGFGSLYACHGSIQEYVPIDDVTIPELPFEYSVYPNPFNPEVTFRLNLPSEALVSIDIFDVRGRKVNTLTQRLYSSGSHQIHWNGKNSDGVAVASGVYLYRISTGRKEFSGKLTLLK